MKKIALLFAITLYAGALNGMEQEYGHYKGLGDLSPEIQVMIIQALNTYDNLNDVIKAIKATSLTNQQLHEVINDMYGNQKDFTKLVHILVDKFSKPDKFFNQTAFDVALAFETPASREYIRLAQELGTALKKNNIDRAKQAIEQGADVNCDSGFSRETPLSYAVEANNFKMVKLLLDSGANPNFDTHGLMLALDYNLRNLIYVVGTEEGKFHYQQAKNIEKLLKEALQKQ